MANTRPLWPLFSDDGIDEDELRQLERELAAEEEYDDLQDHEICEDCRGSGWYTGLWQKYYCPTCDGSGYL